MTTTNLPIAHFVAPADGAGTPDFFAPERFTSAAGLEEAQHACRTDFHYDRTEIDLDRLFLDEDLQLRLGNQRYLLTEAAFEHLCGVLHVPPRFLRTMPADLASTIVQRLRRLHQHAVVLVHRDDVLVGIVDPDKWARSLAPSRRPHYLPVTYLQVLQMIEKVRKPELAVTVNIADSGIGVELVGADIAIEPRPGDITRIGLIVIASETGGPAPTAHGYALRLVCVNGAIAPQDFGVVRFSTDWRVSLERRMEAFVGGLREFTVDMKRIEQAYRNMVANPMTDRLLHRIHRQAAYVYRRSRAPERLADRALGIPDHQRREVVARVRERQRRLRLSAGSSVEAAQPTDIPAWQVFNAITEAARNENEPYRQRVALQRLGGDLLLAYAPRQPNGG